MLGEAGIGKTRLASELVTSLGEQASALIGRCVSYGEGATYLPLAEIVRQIAPERPQATIERLLEGDEQAAVVAERIAELTGQTEGTAATGELFWALRRLFEGLARRSPLVIVLEDLHWAEPTLLDFVDYFAAWPVESPLLLVCLARPGLRDERPGLGAEAEVLRLEPLEDAAIDLLVGELGGAEVGAESTQGGSPPWPKETPSSSSSSSPFSRRLGRRRSSRSRPRSRRCSRAGSTDWSPTSAPCSSAAPSPVGSLPEEPRSCT